MTETNLLPCPFCGGEATVERIGKSGYYYVACNTAYCCDFGKFDTEEEATEAWNTRAEFDGIPMTEENMAEHGWVRERTCDDIAIEGEWFECSECGTVKQLIHPNFCPNCGAKARTKGHLMDSNKDIIERLREWAASKEVMVISPSQVRTVNAFADEIEAQYILLPVDAHGVPIRPGDEMQMALGETAEVVAVGSDRWFFDKSCLADDGEEYDWEWAHSSRHFKLDTVEILLEELVLNHEWGYLGMVCNKDEMDEVIADYAERIRKAVDR